MTTDRDLAELRGVTLGCKLLDLDAAGGDQQLVLVSPGGAALRLSVSAAALIRFAQAGDGLDVIAERFGARCDALQRAADELASRIRDAFGAMTGRRPPGFLAQRKLMSAARVAALARPLTVLFRPWIAAPLLAGAVVWLAIVHGDVQGAPRSPFALWAGFALGLAVMFLHELGHAAACLRHGAPVGDIGCAVYLVYPALFCDVTSTWALPRRARVEVDLGGVYVQALSTAVIAVIWSLTGATVLAATIRISIATMVMNLMPVGRLDGYWVLGDVLGVIDLRAQQQVVLAALWARLRGRPRRALPWRRATTAAIAGYAVASAAFFAMVMVRLASQAALEARLLPERLGELATAVRAGDAGGAALGAGRLISSIAIAAIICLLLRTLAVGLSRRLRRRRA